MGDPKAILFVVLGAVAVWFVTAWIRFARQSETESSAEEKSQTVFHAVVGFVCAFFDTLGIGCFAPTAAAFKFRSSVPDERIPGTLNVGYAIPTIAQAFIYIESVKVDFTTLGLMIVAAVLGSWLGAGFVANWSRQRVQLGMGAALLAAAMLMLMKQFNVFPAGGDALALSGAWLVVGLAANFALGALMTLGIGLYAPCLILVSLLGMSSLAAFPIMAGSCAFLMPVGGLRFVREKSYSISAAIAMTIAGIPAVLVAAFVVKQLPLEYVRWLVVIVVTYAAIMMLRSARIERINP